MALACVLALYPSSLTSPSASDSSGFSPDLEEFGTNTSAEPEPVGLKLFYELIPVGSGWNIFETEEVT